MNANAGFEEKDGFDVIAVLYGPVFLLGRKDGLKYRPSLRKITAKTA